MSRAASQRRRGRPWLAVAGFLLALALTAATVVLTGLYVRAPGPDAGADTRDAGTEPWQATRPASRKPAGGATR